MVDSCLKIRELLQRIGDRVVYRVVNDCPIVFRHNHVRYSVGDCEQCVAQFLAGGEKLGVANKIKSLVFESMEKNCGMSDGEIESEIIRNYVMSLPPEERAAAGWTLNQISLQEADRLGEYVHQRDPSWNWGKPVKPGILDDYKSGMNILI